MRWRGGGASLAGIDIDGEQIDDQRAREFADAAATVVEAVRWRLGRVVRLLGLMAEQVDR